MTGLQAGLTWLEIEQPLWLALAWPLLISGVAVALLALGALVLPPSWRSVFPPGPAFVACFLLAPVVLVAGIAAAALLRDDGEPNFPSLEATEAPRQVDPRWRHLDPRRPPREIQ
ncbi:hypothetical protein [Sabulicella rubraurantiaca]|uniref:hypothetical protein n=1 Tax=Sabulicella rubraurantiaca TaxID=2811429 RepID=UPI001A97221E|nr:hypothetical protein [Sabulicella rubraurantiaca]